MKVLQINSVCGVGSTGRIATDIHAILKEKGQESYIAFGRDTPLNCDSNIRIGNKLDNYSHVAKTRLLDQHGFGSKKATKDFIEKVKKLDPDVIHLHNIHGYYINIETLFDYLKDANKPVVWTLHDCWAFTGHCTNFEYVGCNCWKVEGNHKCSQKRSYPASLLINNSKNNFKRKRKAFTGVENLTIVTPSNWLADLVKQSFLSEYPIKVINNGIDLDVFKPVESTFRERYNLNNKFVILGVANVWSERKGYDYFIKLYNQLKEDEIIIMVGLNEKQIKKLPKNIIGIPRTNSIRELVEIYSIADVFVNPTLEEVMGLTNVEALACGTPVITFNTGGSVECVDEKTGIIIRKESMNQLRKELNNIKERITVLNTNDCIERAKIFYDKNIQYQEYLSLYEMKSSN